jgi:hypothetical protein
VRWFDTEVSGLPSSYTALPLQNGPLGFNETSVNNDESTLCNVPEEGRFHLQGSFTIFYTLISSFCLLFDSIPPITYLRKTHFKKKALSTSVSFTIQISEAF